MCLCVYSAIGRCLLTVRLAMCLCVCVLTDNGSWNVVCMYIDGRTGYVSVCLCVDRQR